MDNKELTDEEKVVIEKAIGVLSSLVSDRIGHAASMFNNNPETREKVKAVASGMHDAFVWKYTKEGQNYWAVVYNKLRRIAEGGF